MMDVDDLDDATLVAGAPRSGKTRFALDMLVAAGCPRNPCRGIEIVHIPHVAPA